MSCADSAKIMPCEFPFPPDAPAKPFAEVGLDEDCMKQFVR